MYVNDLSKGLIVSGALHGKSANKIVSHSLNEFMFNNKEDQLMIKLNRHYGEGYLEINYELIQNGRLDKLKMPFNQLNLN